MSVERAEVRKTWKLYIGGAFVRSESGRYTQLPDAETQPRASRKDARDAVKAARAAARGWAERTAYNRGQILYRLAEMMEARAAELSLAVTRSGQNDADQQVAAAIDRVVSFAGWTDKFQSILASSNPVAGPHFGFSVPEPMGVVAIAAPAEPALLGLVGALAPVLASGNTAVVVASGDDGRVALSLAEMIATSDVPGGVVNVLTGEAAELLVPLSKHLGVRGLDLWNVADPLGRELELAGADGVKRVVRRRAERARWFDADECTSPTWIAHFVELKTVWHPTGV